jgi:hypothetical protein
VKNAVIMAPVDEGQTPNQDKMKSREELKLDEKLGLTDR